MSLSEHSLILPIPQNFSFESCLNFLDRGFEEVLYTIEGQSIIRLISITSGSALISVSSDGNNLLAKITKEKY